MNRKLLLQEDIQEKDSLGRHSIHLAAQAGQQASVEYLVKDNGIDLNMKTTNTGMVPLHYAAKVNFVYCKR